MVTENKFFSDTRAFEQQGADIQLPMLCVDFAFEGKHMLSSYFYFTSIVTEKKYTEIKKLALKLMPLENHHKYKRPMKTTASKSRVGHSKTLEYFCPKPYIQKIIVFRKSMKMDYIKEIGTGWEQ